MLRNYPKLISTHFDPSLTTTNFRYSRWIFILICLPKLVLIKGISHTLIACTHHSRDCIRDVSCFQSNIYSASNMSLCYDPCTMLLWQDISESFSDLPIPWIECYNPSYKVDWTRGGWLLSVGVSIVFICLSVWKQSVCLSVCLSVFLSDYLCIHLSLSGYVSTVWMSFCILSVCLAVFTYVCLSVWLCICLCVCLSLCCPILPVWLCAPQCVSICFWLCVYCFSVRLALCVC